MLDRACETNIDGNYDDRGQEVGEHGTNQIADVSEEPISYIN
jgi:hypothetical protein